MAFCWSEVLLLQLFEPNICITFVEVLTSKMEAFILSDYSTVQSNQNIITDEIPKFTSNLGGIIALLCSCLLLSVHSIHSYSYSRTPYYNRFNEQNLEQNTAFRRRPRTAASQQEHPATVMERGFRILLLDICGVLHWQYVYRCCSTYLFVLPFSQTYSILPVLFVHSVPNHSHTPVWKQVWNTTLLLGRRLGRRGGTPLLRW